MTGLREDGTFYARWFMPYGKGARIVLENRGNKERSVGLTVRTAALSDDLSAYARFGAEWNKLEDRRKGDSRWPDSRYFKAEGSGRYVGVSMHVYQIAQQIWWGEGDEKFFVDGEKTPSWFGTGSEDYFGYAWCQATPFNEPYHGQPLCEGARGTEQVQDAGNKVNYRYHITDSVPFQTSFDANMEKYFDDRFVKMAATTFFYLDPAASASHQVNRFTAGERDFNQIPAQQPALSNEGEDLSPYIRSATGGNAVIQDMGYAATPDRKWSGDAQLWWKCGQEGGELSFTIHAPAAGDYDLSLRLTAAGDYGKLAVCMDGEPLEREADCYAADLSIIEADMGRVRLTAGEHVVTLRCTGKNSASAGYFIGLDRLDLQPVDVPLEGIELDAEALELEIGRGGQLTAALTPEYATDPVLVWKSENEKIVAVDQNGKLTARGVGTAVVTVSSADNPAVKAVCTVTVYRKGDLNADGAITVTDVMACCKVLARKSAGRQPSRDEVLRGDLTGEGGVTITDVMAICKLLAAKA